MTSPVPSLSEYHLDARDRIVAVSAGFRAFARDNGIPALASSALLGSSIWSFIAGLTTRELYASAFLRVRTVGRPVQFPFRCDSPTLRRFMELTIAPGQDKTLQLSAALLRTEDRPAVALLDPTIPRLDQVLECCSFCRSLCVDASHWASVEDAIRLLNLFDSAQLPMLSHSVCPACLPEFRRRLDA